MKVAGVAIHHLADPCPEDKAFFFVDGRRARSLVEFRQALDEIPAFVAGYHRHHFEPWLRDIVGDEPLAERVRQYAEAGGEDAELLRVLREVVARRVEELQPDTYRKAVGALDDVKRRLAERFRGGR